MTKQERSEPHIPVESSKLWLKSAGPAIPQTLIEAGNGEVRYLLDDYFVRSNAFRDTYFRRRFRMERNLFNKITIAVCNHDSYFVQNKDAFGVIGSHS